MKVMIKRIELWLNVIHYFIYKVDYKLHTLFNKVNPSILLGKIPAIKRKLEKQGTSPEETMAVVDKIWTDRRFGVGIMVSGGGVVIVVFLLFLAVFDMANSLLKYPLEFSWKPFIVLMVIAYTLCYITIFQKDKYLDYFKKFDQWSKQKKRRYGLYSLTFVIGVVILWIYSFRFLPPLS